MSQASWESSLLDLSRSIRERHRARRLALLPLVQELDSSVVLRSSASRRFHAATEMESRPSKIVVFRQTATRFERTLQSGEDHVLSPRERFSIAHELGHWLAFARFGVKPESGRGRAYWAQEAVMNAFANSLLVPEALARVWLREGGGPDQVHPFQVRTWAEAVRVSEEVVAHSLTRLGEQIGFLKLEVTERKQKGDALRVSFVASSLCHSLPAIHSHVLDESIHRLFSGSNTGRKTFDAERILGLDSPVVVSWRHIERNGKRAGLWLVVSSAPASTQRAIQYEGSTRPLAKVEEPPVEAHKLGPISR